MSSLDLSIADKLKAKLDAEYKKKMQVIEDFYALAKEHEEAEDEAPTAVAVQPAKAKTAKRKRKSGTSSRTSGLASFGFKIFHLLKETYQKTDVRDLILSKYPQWEGKITKDALDGVMRAFVKQGLAVIEVKNIGRSPVIYRKIAQGSLEIEEDL
jgi:hypothetical protein